MIARTTAAVLNRLTGNLSPHLDQLAPVWQKALAAPATQKALRSLNQFLSTRLRAGAQIYPATPFRALRDLTPETVHVIVLGQDPYHGANQAQGLAFSVPKTCPCPPSLRNMFKELALEYPETFTRQSNNLARWARQGVLLLNTVLTVEADQPASHTRKGWEAVTDALIQCVAHAPQPKVFMFWGNHAQAKRNLIPDTAGSPPTPVLTANHPSPLSAQRPPKPFIGCGHFKQANQWLESHGQPTIDWLRDED